MYAATLEDYLRQPDESCLHRAYELGRSAVREGKSILEMIELHSRSLGRALSTSRSVPESTRSVEAAMVFFREAMSSYEMTNRAFGEANSALQHFNETLEAQVRRIASTLHDESGQLLAVVHIKLEEVARNMPVEVRERLQEVRQVVDQIEGQLRRLSHELRPPVLDDLGLLAALENLAIVVRSRTGLRIIVESTEFTRLPKKIETVFYRIIQEALTNAAKHSRAHDVNVRLWRESGTACCCIEDDGIGFDASAVIAGKAPRGLGLAGIRERLQTLGGGCEIQSAPGKGTKINIRVPVEN
jgi:signal transduction histidine kinase